MNAEMQLRLELGGLTAMVVAAGLCAALIGVPSGLNTTIDKHETIANYYPSHFSEPSESLEGSSLTRFKHRCWRKHGSYYYHGDAICIQMEV